MAKAQIFRIKSACENTIVHQPEAVPQVLETDEEVEGPIVTPGFKDFPANCPWWAYEEVTTEAKAK